MRNTYRIVAAFLTAVSAFASVMAADTTQTLNPPATKADPAQGPRVVFETPVFDFGKIESGEVVKHDFVFTNIGTATLEITAVKPSCGCTTPGSWDKAVEPGKTGKIPVEYNSKNFGGDIKKTIQVSCNDPSQTNVTLEIKANVWKEFDISPSLVSFNFPLDSTERQSRVVKIKSNLGEPVTLSEPEWTNKSYDAVLKTVTEGKEFELTISTAPPQVGANANAKFDIKTSSQKTPVIQVSANTLRQQPITVTPNQLLLPNTPLAKAITNKVTIRNNTTNVLAITEPSLNIPGVEVKLNEVQPGKAFTASVNFPEGFTSPAGQKLELTMKSTLPGNENIRVPVVQTQGGQTPRQAIQVPKPKARLKTPPS